MRRKEKTCASRRVPLAENDFISLHCVLSWLRGKLATVENRNCECCAAASESRELGVSVKSVPIYLPH
jgi:hypothetical protein